MYLLLSLISISKQSALNYNLATLTTSSAPHQVLFLSNTTNYNSVHDKLLVSCHTVRNRRPPVHSSRQQRSRGPPPPPRRPCAGEPADNVKAVADANSCRHSRLSIPRLHLMHSNNSYKDRPKHMRRRDCESDTSITSTGLASQENLCTFLA
jgi:hypothetical protein